MARQKLTYRISVTGGFGRTITWDDPDGLFISEIIPKVEAEGDVLFTGGLQDLLVEFRSAPTVFRVGKPFTFTQYVKRVKTGYWDFITIRVERVIATPKAA